jgi:hypothetical protein
MLVPQRNVKHSRAIYIFTSTHTSMLKETEQLVHVCVCVCVCVWVCVCVCVCVCVVCVCVCE